MCDVWYLTECTVYIGNNQIFCSHRAKKENEKKIGYLEDPEKEVVLSRLEGCRISQEQAGDWEQKIRYRRCWGIFPKSMAQKNAGLGPNNLFIPDPSDLVINSSWLLFSPFINSIRRRNRNPKITWASLALTENNFLLSVLGEVQVLVNEVPGTFAFI